MTLVEAEKIDLRRNCEAKIVDQVVYCVHLWNGCCGQDGEGKRCLIFKEMVERRKTGKVSR